MKRGRPNSRSEITSLILEILSDNIARSANNITKTVSKQLGRNVSWNTVEKYLRELIEMGKVTALSTPHSKKEGKDGLTVYTIKK